MIKEHEVWKENSIDWIANILDSTGTIQVFLSNYYRINNEEK